MMDLLGSMAPPSRWERVDAPPHDAQFSRAFRKGVIYLSIQTAAVTHGWGFAGGTWKLCAIRHTSIYRWCAEENVLHTYCVMS